MPALERFATQWPANGVLITCLLGASFILILPQCSEKNSAEYVQEGLAYIEQQNFDKAEAAFLKAIEKDPRNPEGHYGVGGIYNYRKQYTKAKAAFRTAIKMDPTHFDAHYSLGYAHEQLGEQEEADREFAVYSRLKKKMNSALKKEQEKR